jgi:hypothetical protein
MRTSRGGLKDVEVSKLKAAAPCIVVLVIAVTAYALRPSVLFAADEPSQTPDPAQPTDDDRWQFNVAPYLWGASLNGDASRKTSGRRG